MKNKNTSSVFVSIFPQGTAHWRPIYFIFWEKKAPFMVKTHQVEVLRPVPVSVLWWLETRTDPTKLAWCVLTVDKLYISALMRFVFLTKFGFNLFGITRAWLGMKIQLPKEKSAKHSSTVKLWTNTSQQEHLLCFIAFSATSTSFGSFVPIRMASDFANIFGHLKVPFGTKAVLEMHKRSFLAKLN